MQYNPYKKLPLYKMGPVVGRELLAYDEDYTVNRLFARTFYLRWKGLRC